MSRYSTIVSEHSQSPRNEGRLEAADLVGLAGRPGEGPYLVVYLQLDGNQISRAQFQSHGCGATIASGSVLTELVTGMTVRECQSLTPDELITALDGLPPDKRHCAGFAIGALRNALSSAPSEE